MTKSISLDALNIRAAQEAAFEMEYLQPDGSPSGVTILVLGSHAAAVQAAVSKLLNDQRRRDATRARSKPGAVEFTPVEDDVEFGQKAAAARIAGWRGITEEFTPELALLLCKSNPVLASQVMEASNEAGNFTKASSRG